MEMVKVKESVLTEYGEVSIGDFRTELGITIHDVRVSFERTGPKTSPVIIVCHALTGNQFAVGDENETGWWSGLIGVGKSIDTNKWQVITMNVIGGCNGTTGPLSLDQNNKPYRASFPFVTVRDMVNSQYKALKKMDIENVHAIIGGSLGGMQVLEWGLLYPEFAKLLFPIATSPYLSDYGMAYNSIARYAITNDPTWENGEYEENPEVGLSTARMIGMLSYRSSNQFNSRFSREQRESFGVDHKESTYQIDSYLKYQGEKFLKRFDANSYLYLLKAMDNHDIGQGRGGWQNALRNIRAKVIAISYKGDTIYPSDIMGEFIEICKKVSPESRHYEVETIFGHDGFLVEFEKWGHLVEEGLQLRDSSLIP